MSHFIATVFIILATIIIGTSVILGDSNSIKSSTTELLTRTNSEIHDLTLDYK